MKERNTREKWIDIKERMEKTKEGKKATERKKYITKEK